MTMTLLVMNVNPGLEEDMVDYLLVRDGVEGFTSYRVNGHGRIGGLSVMEQVAGRQKRVQFEVLMEEADVPGVLDGLGRSVGPDIVYWQQPVFGAGRT